MPTIVAIGGGAIGELETESIDREIIELSGKTRPHALFLPTASRDSRPYWRLFRRVYGQHFNCSTDVLYLLDNNPTEASIRQRVDRADIIYVGGGNTLKMMRRWRHLGVDSMLRDAHQDGTVLCGTSAGAICWFEKGHSDSMVDYDPENWKYIAVTGLGLINGMACPHYNAHTLGVARKQDFGEMLKRHGGNGIAIDNHCAVVFKDDQFRVLQSRPEAGAYTLVTRARQVTETQLPVSMDYKPMYTLEQ